MVFEVTKQPLDPSTLIPRVRRDENGAAVIFMGVVRSHNLGRKVLYLEYDAYPAMATRIMSQIGDDVKQRWPVDDIAVQHRIGRLEIGETSLLVVVCSAHRKEAFEACQYAVDRIKESVPIWKKEVWEGGEEWIEGSLEGSSQGTTPAP